MRSISLIFGDHFFEVNQNTQLLSEQSYSSTAFGEKNTETITFLCESGHVKSPTRQGRVQA